MFGQNKTVHMLRRKVNNNTFNNLDENYACLALAIVRQAVSDSHQTKYSMVRTNARKWLNNNSEEVLFLCGINGNEIIKY